MGGMKEYFKFSRKEKVREISTEYVSSKTIPPVVGEQCDGKSSEESFHLEIAFSNNDVNEARKIIQVTQQMSSAKTSTISKEFPSSSITKKSPSITSSSRK